MDLPNPEIEQGFPPLQADSLPTELPVKTRGFAFFQEVYSPQKWRKSEFKLDSVQDFPGGPVVKTPPANAGDAGQSLVWEDPTCQGTAKPLRHND